MIGLLAQVAPESVPVLPAGTPPWLVSLVTIFVVLGPFLLPVKAWLSARAREAEARAAKAEAEAHLAVVVRGVEAFAGPGAHPLKDTIRAVAEVAGVQPTLDAAVQKATATFQIPKLEDEAPKQ